MKIGHLSLTLFAAALACCKSISLENDAGLDTDCGQVDSECCDVGAKCEPGLLCVSGADPEDPQARICLLECTVPTCSNIAGDTGTCHDVGLADGTGACLAPEDLAESPCSPNDMDCATPSGATEGTICLTDGESVFCVEMCAIEEDGCDDDHSCLATSTGGGVCVPD